MKPNDAKSSLYIDCGVENNNKDLKLDIGDHVIISKYKSIVAKVYTPNSSEEVFAIKKVKNAVLGTYIIEDLNDEKIVGTVYDRELQKTNQIELRI